MHTAAIALLTVRKESDSLRHTHSLFFFNMVQNFVTLMLLFVGRNKFLSFVLAGK